MNQFKKSTWVLLILWFSVQSTGMARQIISSEKINEIPPGNFHLFLLVGQSNMAGSASIEPQDTISNQRILSLNRKGNWVVANNPLREDKNIPGISPGVSFAQRLLKSDSTLVIGLIPAAVGGTSINLWQEDSYDSITQIYPYNEAIHRIKIAMRDGVLKAILWHQGESDSRSDRVQGYSFKLTEVFENFKRDLEVEEIPILVGTLPHFQYRKLVDDKIIKNPSAKKINKAIRGACARTENCKLVKLNKLTDKGDGTHLDAQSVREMGFRYAENYLKNK